MSGIFALLSTAVENWSPKHCHLIGSPLNLCISIFRNLTSIWTFFCGLEETLSQSLLWQLLLSHYYCEKSLSPRHQCILSLNKNEMLISWSNSSIWTNSRISLFNRFICPFVQLLSLYDLFWYMKQISWYKFI